jgi:hypothetical protein
VIFIESEDTNRSIRGKSILIDMAQQWERLADEQDRASDLRKRE